MATSPVSTADKLISQNKKARFDYHIVETLEAGLVLTGSEIKSMRTGEVTLTESFVAAYGRELFLVQAHIKAYRFDANTAYDPVRKRKLLLHRNEIDKLIVDLETAGLTIIPLRLYLKKGRAKLEIALAKGKSAPDKRQSIKGREAKREIDRAIKNAR